jgi:peptide/nickel transport system ATP-binding protein
LHIHFPTDDGLVKAVDGLSFTVERGKTLGIVGESGSGKSVTSLGILGLHNRRNAQVSGEIWVDGKELVSADPEDVRKMRGDEMAMIFQDPLSAMHPYYRVGTQIAEAYRVHNDVSRAAARDRAIELLDLVGIPEPSKRVDSYPHQFSGGMRQRAMIAMALSCNPAIILITHDLGVVAEVADDVLVMYAGHAVEYGSVSDIFYQPEHPYTWGLLGSVTRLDRLRQDRLQPIPGNPPSLINVPSGCPFHPRCAYGELNGGKEREIRPELAEGSPGHLVACHLPFERRREIFNAEVATRL